MSRTLWNILKRIYNLVSTLRERSPGKSKGVRGARVANMIGEGGKAISQRHRKRELVEGHGR